MAGTLTIASSSATPSGCEAQVLSLVRQAVAHMDEAQTVAALRAGLVEMAKRGDLHSLEFPAAHRDHYSRRCVYSDPWERFSIIAMTWNVGQGTPLHDHSGVWCVEVVVDGIMEVVNYQMLDEDHFGHCRFEKRETLPAYPASSGALIPPFEHHVFSNVGAIPSHTLHVYGGPMSRCDIFQPIGEGWFQRQHRELRFDR